MVEHHTPTATIGWTPSATDWDRNWAIRAACRDMDPDRLFVTGAAQSMAKSVCFGCRVRAECLAVALDERIEFGVWGGTTERERRAMLRRRPDVRSWRELIIAARAAYERAQSDAEEG